MDRINKAGTSPFNIGHERERAEIIPQFGFTGAITVFLNFIKDPRMLRMSDHLYDEGLPESI